MCKGNGESWRDYSSVRDAQSVHDKKYRVNRMMHVGFLQYRAVMAGVDVHAG